MPNTQTKATERWQKKAGYATKGFKIKVDLAERFRQACEKNGESQAAAISRLMEKYISGEK